MSFLKFFGFMLVIWLLYIFVHHEIMTPDSLSPTVFNNMNTVYHFLRKPLNLLGFVIEPDVIKGNESFFQFAIPLAWGILTIPLCYNPNAKYDKKVKKKLKKGIIYEYESAVEEEKINILPSTSKEKFLDSLSMLKLTSLEKAIFYRFSLVLHDDYKEAFRKQILSMNRNQRIRVKNDGTMYITSFDSYKCLLFKNNSLPVLPANKNGREEYILVSAVILNEKQEGANIELWVHNRKIVRLIYESDNDIAKLRGPFYISDITLNKNL